MWESPIYRFEEETTDKNGKIIKKPFLINVTYSAPRNLDNPGKALIGVFERMTHDLNPAETQILDVGAAKLRNTLWLLQKGFNVWAVEFPELRDRLPDAKKRWEAAGQYKNFHNVTFPKDFIDLKEKFDIVLLINVINVMPIPMERFALLSLCRQKIKDQGMMLWHQWRGIAIGGPAKYSEDNAFVDGYLMGNGPHHSFYVENNREESHEIMYSIGFSFNRFMNLHTVPANTCYSYVFNPTHDMLISNALDLGHMLKIIRDPSQIMNTPDEITVLDLYKKELGTIPPGPENAHKYHLLASRIFFEIFRSQLGEPVVEREINEGRGRIDITYGNRNKEGIFKNLKDLRNIMCPEIMVECKNYTNDLTNNEYSQLSDRLIPTRGILGFLLCRDKKDEKQVLKHCQDRLKGGKYIIVLDDNDLIQLAKFKLDEEDDCSINDIIDEKIKQIVD
jgi:hypothetical protein